MPPEFLSPIRNGRPGWLFQTQWTFPGGGDRLAMTSMEASWKIRMPTMPMRVMPLDLECLEGENLPQAMCGTRTTVCLTGDSAIIN